MALNARSNVTMKQKSPDRLYGSHERVRYPFTMKVVGDAQNIEKPAKINDRFRKTSRKPSEGSSCNRFTLFCDLPKELQLLIWKHTMKLVTMVELRIEDRGIPLSPRCTAETEAAALLQVCQDSRVIAKRTGQLKINASFDRILALVNHGARLNEDAPWGAYAASACSPLGSRALLKYYTRFYIMDSSAHPSRPEDPLLWQTTQPPRPIGPFRIEAPTSKTKRSCRFDYFVMTGRAATYRAGNVQRYRALKTNRDMTNLLMLLARANSDEKAWNMPTLEVMTEEQFDERYFSGGDDTSSMLLPMHGLSLNIGSGV